MLERMYTIREASIVLRKSIKTVRRYIRNGDLHALRSGSNSVVIPESKLMKFMKPTRSTEEARIMNLIEDEILKLS